MYQIIYAQPNNCGMGLPQRSEPLERWNIVLGLFEPLVHSIVPSTWRAFYKQRILKLKNEWEKRNKFR